MAGICWECDKEFDHRGLTCILCPECELKQYEQDAEDMVGKRVELCYSYYPNCWSPVFVDGRALRHDGRGRVIVDCEDGEQREAHVCNISVYIEQLPPKPKPGQLSLFNQEVA